MKKNRFFLEIKFKTGKGRTSSRFFICYFLLHYASVEIFNIVKTAYCIMRVEAHSFLL